MHPARIWQMTTRSVTAWLDDYAPSMGAALAFYMLFSLAPLLIIAIAVAGLFFSKEAASGEIVAQIESVVGFEGALAVQGILRSASKPAQDMLATLVSIVTLIIGATSVFAELQSALDRIWRAPAPLNANGLWALLRARVLSFGLVLGLGFLLLVSLLLGAAIAALGKWSGGLFAGWGGLLHGINFCMSFLIATALFAMLFKLMPRASVAWRDVWVGAAVTALLFEIGKLLIGLYLGKTGIASSFGAAGSLVVLLIWVYFSAQIFLLGAEFTWVYSHEYGSRAARPEAKSASIVPSRSGGASGKAIAKAPVPR